MRSRVLLIVAVVVALYALVCLAVALAQSRLVYYPGPAPTETPRDHGLTYDDLSLRTRDGDVQAVGMPGRGASQFQVQYAATVLSMSSAATVTKTTSEVCGRFERKSEAWCIFILSRNGEERSGAQ